MTGRLDETLLESLARMALANLVREYPNHVTHMLGGDVDALPPRKLHPLFYGAYDWHSAVHNYWMLVRLLRLVPASTYAEAVRALLERELTSTHVAQECAYFMRPNRASFERPYGLAWLLQLSAELAEWDSPEARRWRGTLRPLEQLAAVRFESWLPKLAYPIRSGEHSQSAFAFGLAHDWARVVGHATLQGLIETKSCEFHGADVDAPLAYEPSGHDFLSPLLAEADLMRRVLPPSEYARWLKAFLPKLPRDGDGAWLNPASTTDPSDPKLAHIDGLNLSRAWMLEGISAALPVADARVPALTAAAQRHAAAGIAAIRAERYEGSHWLPSFAVYLLTRRGIHAHG